MFVSGSLGGSIASEGRRRKEEKENRAREARGERQREKEGMKEGREE